jgi:CBS domain-containing protein
MPSLATRQAKEAPMKVSECMTRNVTLANPDMTLCQAARMMAECDAGVLPVGENDRLIGMLTDRDIAIRGVAENKGPDATVREAMSPEVRWCYEDDDIEEVLQNMADEQIRRMPVLNRDKRLVGIVSIGDLSASAPPQRAGMTLESISRHGGQHNQTMH